MIKSLKVSMAVAAALFAAPAYAQNPGATAGAVELTIVPGGGLFFVGGDSESRFRDYDVGGALAVKINQYVGVEVEGLVGLGMYHQNLVVAGTALTEAPPNVVDLSADMTLSMPGGTHHTIPYAAAGLGSFIVLTHTDLGIGASKAFLSGNVGGGLKWYANERWGLRADYRLVLVSSSDSAPAFFGREGRVAHRIYGGVLLNLVN